MISMKQVRNADGVSVLVPSMTKQRAIREVREAANDVIEQLQRWDKGWDKGVYRDNIREVDICWHLPARQEVRQTVAYAFGLSAQFAEVV